MAKYNDPRDQFVSFDPDTLVIELAGIHSDECPFSGPITIDLSGTCVIAGDKYPYEAERYTGGNPIDVPKEPLLPDQITNADLTMLYVESLISKYRKNLRTPYQLPPVYYTGVFDGLMELKISSGDQSDLLVIDISDPSNPATWSIISHNLEYLLPDVSPVMFGTLKSGSCGNPEVIWNLSI